MDDCPVVQRNPHRVHGAWTFGDTRLPLYIIFENLAAGATIEEVSQWFEGVTEEQIKLVLSHLAHMLEEDRITEESRR